MSQRESALKRLGEGEFICHTRFPEEYEYLESDEGRKVAEAWVAAVGYRIARLKDDGAFFMAHNIVTQEMRAKVRAEMKEVRNRLEPVVGFMETIRQAQGRNPQIHPGDMIFLSEISEIIRGSSMLERRLQDMREIGGSRVGEATQDRVLKMLKHLESEGYVTETNASHKGFCVTGKIDYLYQLIGYIAVNTTHLSDEDVVDQIDQQGKLDDASDKANEKDAQP